MTNPTYAPFPTVELDAIARECDKLLDFIRDGELRTRITARAKVCRDAIACHDALRERFLESEHRYRLALAGQSEKSNAA